MNTALFSLHLVSADDLRWRPDPEQRLPCIDCHGLGPREFAALAAVLSREPRDAVLEKMRLLAGESQESPWVIAMPDLLVSAIADLPEEADDDLVRRWQQMADQVALLDRADLGGLLGKLREFVRAYPAPFALRVTGSLQ